jgi:hypothetical protein
VSIILSYGVLRGLTLLLQWAVRIETDERENVVDERENVVVLLVDTVIDLLFVTDDHHLKLSCKRLAHPLTLLWCHPYSEPADKPWAAQG